MSGATFSEHVAQRLASPRASDGPHRYLVTDQSAFHGIAVMQELGWIDAPAIDILGRRTVDWARCAGPVLMPAPEGALTESQRQRWLAFAERWRMANAMTYFEHRVEPTQLSVDLNDRTRGLLPDRMSVVLRWFDNRVMASLDHILRPAQRTALWQGCEHFVYADRRGAAVVPEPFAAAQAVPLPITLNVDQQAALMQASEADTVINVLLDQATPALLRMLPPDQHVLVSVLLRSAAAHGIGQLSDQVAYCHLGLELGADFDLHAPWKGVIEEARKDGGKLVHALSRFKEAVQ